MQLPDAEVQQQAVGATPHRKEQTYSAFRQMVDRQCRNPLSEWTGDSLQVCVCVSVCVQVCVDIYVKNKPIMLTEINRQTQI